MGVFEKDNEELLNYDGHAFLYFALTGLTVFVLPWTYYLVNRIRNPRPPDEFDFDSGGRFVKEDQRIRHCRTASMEVKRQNFMADAQKRRFGGSVGLQIAVLAGLWVCLFKVTLELKDAPAQLRKFDPYQILGIEPGAELRDIKKAYRAKSLQHHPDKDKDNPLAPVLFQEVSKAYAALTDDAARLNYEKYGNPDGGGQTKVGIALHPSLLVKENQMLTLCLFFFGIFSVPFSIVCCHLRRSNFSAGGVCQESLRIFNCVIDLEVTSEDCPGLLAASIEERQVSGGDIRELVQAMTITHPDTVEAGKLVMVVSGDLKGRRGIVKSYPPPGSDGQCEVEIWPASGIPPQGPQDVELKMMPSKSVTAAEPRIPCPFGDAPIRRGVAVLWAHMWRLHAHMAPAVQVELSHRLLAAPKLGRAMTSIAIHGEGDRSGYIEIVRNMIKLQQCLVQALDFDSSPLLQLPHVKEVPKKGAPSLREVLESGGDEALLKRLGKFTPDQALDIQSFCRHAPLVELSTVVEVFDEDAIAEGDMATLKVTLTRNNLEEGEAVGPVHAPFYPGPKYEEWWILVYDDQGRRMITADVVLGTGRSETCNVNFMVPRHGDFRWRVIAMCDSYAGLDVECPVNFLGRKKSEVDRSIFIHPNDKELKSFFEELMMGLEKGDDDDSDSEEEEDKHAASKPMPSPAVVQAVEAEDDGGHLDNEDVKQMFKASEDVEEEKTPAVASKPSVEGDSDEEDEETLAIPNGVYYQIVEATGSFLHREPEEGLEFRLGSVPSGTILRGFEGEDRPQGWLEVRMGENIVWVQVDGANSIEDEGRKGEPAKRLGDMMDQSLSDIVKSNSPLILLRRWMKITSRAITAEDMIQVREMDNVRGRMLIEDMARRRLGDAKFDVLLDEAEALAKKFKTRITKARGFFQSGNGIVWQVLPEGSVKGLHQDGSRIRDKVQVTWDDRLQIGPFVLDEKKTCSCIHWLRKDDPEKAWTWSRDNTLRSRIRIATGEPAVPAAAA